MSQMGLKKENIYWGGGGQVKTMYVTCSRRQVAWNWKVRELRNGGGIKVQGMRKQPSDWQARERPSRRHRFGPRGGGRGLCEP